MKKRTPRIPPVTMTNADTVPALIGSLYLMSAGKTITLGGGWFARLLDAYNRDVERQRSSTRVRENQIRAALVRELVEYLESH
jgi:hypothetical protein